MANNDSKKYISLSRLSNFLDNIKAKYSQIGHKHKISDLTDYTPITVDSSLSSNSTNPVQNKILNAEFDAIGDAMGALELAIDGKAESSHNHDDKYYTEEEIDGKLAGKADSSHSHSNYVSTSRTVNGKALSSNISLSASDVGALPNTTSIPDSLSDLSSDSTHRTVTDSEKATWNAKSNFSGNYNDLTNKPTIPSTAGLATEAYVNDVAGTKVDKVNGKGLSTNDYTTTEKNKLSGIASGAEVNQNAFSNVVVGTTTIAADSKTDSLTIAAGDGVSITGDATNDKVTITNSGVRSISTGSSNGTISVNTNGTSTNVAVKGLGSAAYKATTAFDAAGSADTALASAKEYTDNKVSGLASTTFVGNKIDTHNTSTSAHNDIRDLISGLTTRLNTLANSDDTTLDQMSEVVAYIKNNKSLIDGITTSKVNVADIINNLTTNVTNKPLSAAQGAAIKNLIDALQEDFDSHSHAISDVSGLQSALDGKADSSHGTHVSYSTTAPVMDGTASVGSASTVARSDHKHPTDTSRAAKTDLDSHTGNTTVHITATERTNWNTAKTTAESAKTRADNAYTLAESKVGSLSDLGITATTTELNYVDGVKSNVQTQLDELRHDVDSIPQADWNQNDSTKLDFVKNRPFYTADPEETVIAEGTIPANGTMQTSASISSLTLGEAYNVVFDGVAYNNLVCINYDGLPSLGNDAFMFAIQSGRAMAYAANGSASHTIKVMALLSSVVSLERKYIAEHIDNLAGEKVAGKSYTVDGESVTAGKGAEVFNDYSTNIASGQYSHAEGMNNIASGDVAHAEGWSTVASGSYSHTEGYENTASGSRSHAEGWSTEATGQAAHAEGFATHATGQFSHAEGDNSRASGRASHAEGYSTDAIADYSHAEGLNTNASSEYQHVQGKYNVIDAEDTYAHIVGNGTSNSSRKNIHTLDWKGNTWFAGNVYIGGTGQDDAATLTGVQIITWEADD